MIGISEDETVFETISPLVPPPIANLITAKMDMLLVISKDGASLAYRMFPYEPFVPIKWTTCSPWALATSCGSETELKANRLFPRPDRSFHWDTVPSALVVTPMLARTQRAVADG